MTATAVNAANRRPRHRSVIARRLGVALVVAVLAAFTTVALGAKVKVKTQVDKEFSFKALRTYAWHPSGAGEFKILQTTGEDPEALRARFEPVIKRAVDEIMAARGFQLVPAEQAELQIYYYMLIGPGISSQYMGQFMGGSMEWGLPPFAGAATSFEAYEQGSLILDISSPKLTRTVWRGAAQAEVDRQKTAAERDQRISDGVRQMLKSFPPKK